jgi:hypothetical protein
VTVRAEVTYLAAPRGRNRRLGGDVGTISFVFNRLDSFDMSVDVPDDPARHRPRSAEDTARPLECTSKETMPKHDHHKAAAHHEEAAKSHRKAAEAHEAGDTEQASQHSQIANDHSTQAQEASHQAHQKTKGPKKL